MHHNKLQDLVKKSKLLEQEQNDLLYFLRTAEPLYLQQLITLFENDPSVIEFFYDSVRAKDFLLKNFSPQKWEELIEQEYNHIIKQ